MSDPVRSGPEARFAPMEISGGDFRRLAEFIQRTYGIDLSKKRQLITGRLSSTLRQRGYDSCSQFVDHLLQEKDNEEITLVLNQLTTNYTFFMREKEHLTLFCQKIIPELVQRHQRDRTLAIWSAGCSTGEDPYNLTMFLYDYLGSQAKNWDTRILATDISDQALTAAKRGIYELPDTLPPLLEEQVLHRQQRRHPHRGPRRPGQRDLPPLQPDGPHPVPPEV